MAYSGMEQFFPADRILMTGNPIRDNMHPCTDEEKRAGQEMFSLDPSLPTVLIVGGSGGCGTFNSVMSTACRKNGGKFPYQIIWQSGKGYASSVTGLFGSLQGTVEKDGLRICGNVRNCDFISRMDLQSRSRNHIGTVLRRQGHDIRPLSQCRRRSPDPQRHGTGRPGRRLPGMR